MAFTQRQLDDLVAWTAATADLAVERRAAQQRFFGEDDPRPVRYWEGAEDPTSRHRRFLGYFLFTHRLPDGRSPAEVGAGTVSEWHEREEAVRAVQAARYVMAVVSSVFPGQAVFLTLERERFEVRDRQWSRQLTPQSTVYAHLVPSRRGIWLVGPGWLQMPLRLGPGMRSHLRDLQPDPISLERLLQRRSAEHGTEELPRPPADATLEEAVARMTAEAQAAGKDALIMAPSEWEAVVVQYLRTPDLTAFAHEIVQRVGDVGDIKDLNHWMALANNIWNTTPQPDRGGKSAYELSQELREQRGE